SAIESIDTTPPLPIEHRHTTDAEVNRILASAQVSSELENDAVLDAIRHQSRALDTDDTESRFILLWFALERMVLGAPGHGKALGAARELIPKAIAIGKVNTEIAALANAIDGLDLTSTEWNDLHGLIGWRSPEHRRIDRNLLLKFIQGEQSKSMD